MAIEMGLWRADGGKLTRLTTSGVALESQLEDYIESDPTLLGQVLMIIGRQVATAHGGYIDLLAVDAEGVVHILELKRDKTPRDVVAQALDYGSWVATLGRAEIVGIFEAYTKGLAFEEAFAETFNEAPPEDLNDTQVLTIVAASVDPATERIVRFLNETYAVPVNVVFFRSFEDDGNTYLARTWLVDQEAQTEAKAVSRFRKTKEPWNGSDWYVSFGDDGNGLRVWDDARTYGFISAGGGRWFSRTLNNLNIGDRIFACMPKTGYVGVGTVTKTAVRFDQAYVHRPGDEVDILLSSLPLKGSYIHDPSGSDPDETAEYVVAVEWEKTVPADQGFWKPGMFANQNSACKLRSVFTIEQVIAYFGLDS